MRSLIASLLTASAVMPMFWFDVSPNGAAICNSATEFNTQLETSAQRTAAKYAKAKFCSVVATKI